MSKTKPATGRILIIEDDWDILEVLKLMLEDEGHQVVTATDGRDALAAAAAKRFDVVVMDISMPEMSGIEIAQALRADPKTADVQIAIHTGLQERWVKERFPDYDLFLTKAEDVSRLVAGIARLVAQPRAARNAPAQAAAAFSAEDVMQAQLGLRQTMGLGPEAFGAAQFIGMLGDEIRHLRDIGRNPAEIAALISKAIGRELPAALLEQHAPR